MRFNKVLNLFYKSLQNEIDIDNYYMLSNNLNKPFTPVRAIKTLKTLNKFRINGLLYSSICVLFIIIAPILFFIKMIIVMSFGRKKPNYDPCVSSIMLMTDDLIVGLYSNVYKKEFDGLKINVRGLVKNSMGILESIKLYILSIAAFIYVLFKLENKTDILQAYMCFDWMCCHRTLSEISDKNMKIYFNNHYDRWAVMFDDIFKHDILNLIQHGVLPKDIKLSNKLYNIDKIYCINHESERVFKKYVIVGCQCYVMFDLNISLTSIVSNNKVTLLVVNQPYSTDRELEILASLNKTKIDVYVKMHPLFNGQNFINNTNITIIDERFLFPDVDLVLSYNSTLGVQYEQHGTHVIWWENLSVEQTLEKIDDFMLNHS